ncbi:MAG: hypothetical protein HQK51_20010 [Oligoflexia bacterium]|nr:hypothetical protein [Oligoflexia bacterium]
MDSSNKGTDMITWKNADASDLRLLQAITILFANHPRLSEYIFDLNKSKLRDSPSKLKEDAREFSTGEYLLIRVALDIWSGDGGLNFNEIYEQLDHKNIANLIKPLHFLEGNMRGQLK